MIKPLTLISLLLTASLSVFADEIPMAELLAKCDGMTRTGTIDPKSKDGVIGGFAEKQCATKASIAQDRASIAQNDARIAKLDDDYKKMVQILAMLSPAEAKKVIADEILRMEKQLSQEKNPTTVKSLESKLNALRTEQQKLK